MDVKSGEGIAARGSHYSLSSNILIMIFCGGRRSGERSNRTCCRPIRSPDQRVHRLDLWECVESSFFSKLLSILSIILELIAPTSVVTGLRSGSSAAGKKHECREESK